MKFPIFRIIQEPTLMIKGTKMIFCLNVSFLDESFLKYMIISIQKCGRFKLINAQTNRYDIHLDYCRDISFKK